MKTQDLQKMTKDEIIKVAGDLINDIKQKDVDAKKAAKVYESRIERLTRISQIQTNEINVADMVFSQLESAGLIDRDDLNTTINFFQSIKDFKK